MSSHEQNKKAIQEGQQGGPAQKNQNAQLGLSGERAENAKSGVRPGGDSGAGREEEFVRRNNYPGQPAPNPGQAGTPGGKGKQDAPQNQKR
jgi:hypothetical protein